MTVKLIAELAGVSIGTVDRVLHNRGRVAPRTKERVEAVIAAHGYAPNLLARHLKRGKRYVFAVLAPKGEEDSGYWAQAFTGIQEAERSLSAFGITINLEEFDRYDPKSFQLASSRAAKADAILMAPVMREASAAFIAKIDGHVPYAFFDASLPEAAPAAAIGQDPYAAGFLAGRLSRLLAAADGSFIALSSHGEDFHIGRRKTGFAEYFHRFYPNCVIQFEDEPNLENHIAANQYADKVIHRVKDLRGFFVANSAAHGLGAALRKAKLKQRIAVVGFDLVPPNKEELQLGGIDIIISQRPQHQIRAGLEALHRRVVLGQEESGQLRVPIDIFLKENIPTGQER